MSKIRVNSGDRVVFARSDGSTVVIDFGGSLFHAFAPGILDTCDIEPGKDSVTVHVRRKRDDE